MKAPNDTKQGLFEFKSGSNQQTAIIDNRVFYFSYNTIVAFAVDGDLTISENIWGVTTAKHMGRPKVNHTNITELPYDDFREALTAEVQAAKQSIRNR